MGIRGKIRKEYRLLTKSYALNESRRDRYQNFVALWVRHNLSGTAMYHAT
jgi:hypothetical protein